MADAKLSRALDNLVALGALTRSGADAILAHSSGADLDPGHICFYLAALGAKVKRRHLVVPWNQALSSISAEG